jgi:Tol biopolymer transport system component
MTGSGSPRTKLTTACLSTAVLVGLIASTLAVATPARATFPGENGRIAFSRNGAIFTIEPDGSNLTRLTRRDSNFNPVWSPNGRRIAFVHCPATCEVRVMRADGSDVTTVSGPTRGVPQPPVWSPNGRWVAFADDAFDADPRFGAIFIARTNGSVLRRLTGYRSLNTHPAWAPDGTKIAFSSDRDGDGEIFVIELDGSGTAKLTDDSSLDHTPDWSPDGSTIAFSSTVEAPGPGDAGSTIDVVDANGTGRTSLTDGSRFDMMPSWSPDGAHILFRGDASQGANQDIDLYRIQADGGGLAAVTPDETLDLEGVWSPDGERIAFATADDVIFAASSDGTAVVEVADGHAVDWQPVVAG